MISTLKQSFCLSSIKDIYCACMNILLRCITITEPKFRDIKLSFLVSCKEKLVSNKFIQAILKIELIEYSLKETDFQYLYNVLLKSEELNDRDLRFLSYLELVITSPEYFTEVNFSLHLNEVDKNIYRIETHAINLKFNSETVKHSYNELLKDVDSITFIFNTIFHEQWKDVEDYSFEFANTLRDYFNSILSDHFEEGAHGNFISEYERRYHKETIYFINR